MEETGKDKSHVPLIGSAVLPADDASNIGDRR